MSQKNRPSAQRFFVATGYFPGSEGVFKPAIPETCPERSSRKVACDIRVHFARKRKTGPRFPLTVVRCYTHDCSFTLYPFGFGPYLRAPVLDLAPDGTVPLPEKNRKQELEEFEGTIFQAALDGERRKTWARDSFDGVSDQWWSTQGRQIELAQRLLGISRDIGARLREKIAAVLSIDHLFLRDLSMEKRDGYHSRGKSVCSVLRRMKRSATTAMRLFFCGHLIGHWAIPWMWDSRRRLLQCLPFQLPPIRAPA